ncbi:MAG TPA: endonuclease domain-containing protein [Trebonia sp.]|jgi:hypothetical protein
MNKELCGELLPLKRVPCARRRGHGGYHKSAEVMERNRARQRARVRTDPLEVRRRWQHVGRLARYGLTEERFNQILERQGSACAMCREPFKGGRQICIDHDHACCPGKRSSCGKCVRGFLCPACNVALGKIEQGYELACVYLARGFVDLEAMSG